MANARIVDAGGIPVVVTIVLHYGGPQGCTFGVGRAEHARVVFSDFSAAWPMPKLRVILLVRHGGAELATAAQRT